MIDGVHKAGRLRVLCRRRNRLAVTFALGCSSCLTFDRSALLRRLAGGFEAVDTGVAIIGELTGPVAQRHQIRAAQTPACSGEKAQHCVGSFGVAEDPENRENFDDLRCAKESAEADDLYGYTGRLKRSAKRFELAAATAEDGDSRPQRPPVLIHVEKLAAFCLDESRQRSSLVGERAIGVGGVGLLGGALAEIACEVDLSGWCVGPGQQPGHLKLLLRTNPRRRNVERSRHGVRRSQDARGVPPCHREVNHGRRLPPSVRMQREARSEGTQLPC